jgi:hypothetical protein
MSKNYITPIIKCLNGIDLKDWSQVESTLADQIYLDYSSLTGIPARSFFRNELIEYWQARLGKVKYTQHINTNHEVKFENDKEVQTYSLAQILYNHPIKDYLDHWFVYGSYEHKLELINDSWKISSVTLNYNYQLGNHKLLSQID